MDARDWPEADVGYVRLACVEALANAIEHGNHNLQGATIDVQMSCDSDCVEIVVKDQGDGFDPNEVADPRQWENIGKAGGRGILLIRETMCHVGYNDRGNQVSMSKFRRRKLG
jgi:serine/threonine-protein kinase RsbW